MSSGRNVWRTTGSRSLTPLILAIGSLPAGGNLRGRRHRAPCGSTSLSVWHRRRLRRLLAGHVDVLGFDLGLLAAVLARDLGQFPLGVDRDAADRIKAMPLHPVAHGAGKLHVLRVAFVVRP